MRHNFKVQSSECPKCKELILNEGVDRALLDRLHAMKGKN